MLDASVTLAWCFQDEATSFTENLLDLLAGGASARVPAVWPLEVCNALLSAERRKRITTAHTTAFLSRLRELPISVEAASIALAFDQILSLGRAQGITEYDASYLELAIRESLTLATLDENLRRAGRSLGVKLMEK